MHAALAHPTIFHVKHNMGMRRDELN